MCTAEKNIKTNKKAGWFYNKKAGCLVAREPVVRYGGYGSGTQAVFMAVLYDKYTPIPVQWNTREYIHPYPLAVEHQ